MGSISSYRHPDHGWEEDVGVKRRTRANEMSIFFPFSHRPVWWSLHKRKGLGEIDEDEPHSSSPQNQGFSQAATSRSARGCVTIQRRSLSHHPEINHAIIYILFRDGFTELIPPAGLSAPSMLCFSAQGFCFTVLQNKDLHLCLSDSQHLSRFRIILLMKGINDVT